MARSANSRELDPAERAQLVNYVLSLRKDRVQALLSRYELPRRTGTLAQLRARLHEALEAEELTAEQVLAHLDESEPYAKQHVFLYDVPAELADAWRDPDAVRAKLAAVGLDDRLGDSVPVALPEEPTVSVIRAADGRVEVTVIERRSYTERDTSLDREEEVNGEAVEYRAFVHRVARGLVRLEWDLTKNLAELHVTQGQRGYDYEDAATRFSDLVSTWLPFHRFERQPLRKAIVDLHERERGSSPLTRSQRFGLETKGGRDVDVTSPSVGGSVVGEKDVDDAVAEITKTSRGRIGNVYWLERPTDGIDHELHTMIVASAGRIHFMRPMTPKEMSYVLRQIRSLL